LNVFQEEKDRMMEALGLKPKRPKSEIGAGGAAVSSLSAVELKAALARGNHIINGRACAS
jgi:hypothetical protein